MAEDQIEARKDYLKELAPWTKLFSAFKIALDPKKLVLAGGGILVMALGWYVLSVVFFSIDSKRPDPKDYKIVDVDLATRNAAWQDLKRDRHRWYLLYEMAGRPTEKVVEGAKPEIKYVAEDAVDQAVTLEEFAKGKPVVERFKPYGQLCTLPWFEDRGPNPYLLVTGHTKIAESGEGVVNWLIREQLPVLLEPLVKFFKPVVYLFDPAAGFWNRVYLFLVILWSLATWAFFGGAITRIAAVQAARANERVGLGEAVKFVCARYKAYLTAPVFPLLFLGVLTAVLVVFGLCETWFLVAGDLLVTLFWPIALLTGLIMAVVLVGLIGWPLMYTTISAEGSDSFDAISRSYSYVYQAPWQYLWYSFVALVYGAVVVFFVGFMGSLTVYLTKWAVTLPPTMEKREPSYLFQWAPTSFGWRDLLLNKSPNSKMEFEVNTQGRPQDALQVKEYAESTINWHNNIGAFIVSVWLYLMFLLIVGFGYSYFWSASTIIYLLMRRKVDDTEMDEIHLEEEPEQPFPPPAAPAAAVGNVSTVDLPKANPSPLQMVDSPQLRPPAAAPATMHAPPSEPPPAAQPAKDAPPPH